MLLLDYIEVPEVNYTTAVFDTMVMEGSGSGNGPIKTFSNLTVLENERAGQVYAYRYNETTVVLGTRKREVFGAAVGIGEASSGLFKCIAYNELNQDHEQVIDIKISSKCFCYIYI